MASLTLTLFLAICLAVSLVSADDDWGEDDRLECGKQTIRSRRKTKIILGGVDAFDGEFPFMVSLRVVGIVSGHNCGGVILRKLWILTAAHCVTDFPKTSFMVRAGEYDLTKSGSNHTKTDYPLEKIILHPDFYDTKGTFKRYNNDIALLKLQKPIQYDSYTWPICLPKIDEDFTRQMGTVIGWGFKKGGGRESSILQKVQVPVINRTRCQDLLDEAKSKMKLEYGQICAGYRDGKRDACKGDSGGPLFVRKDGRFTVIGVVSIGEVCVRPSVPGIYTYVPNHVKWIAETMES